MRNALFTDEQFDRMAAEVLQLLAEVGYVVDHPQVKQMALKAGCRESPAGRVLFDPAQVEELRARLRRQYPEAAPGAPEPSIVRPPRELRVNFGNLTPRYFDYAADAPRGGSTAALTELVKFAHAEPRVSSVTIPLSRQDAPPATEQLESVFLMAGLTDKTIGEVDATLPESVPYLAEMGQALGRSPADFVGRCNCINPPLRLEQRTAETMLRRARYHCMSMVTSMPCIGGSGPVDIYGCVVLATAEIVGGLILSAIIDPEAPLLGYIACIQVDMRTGKPTSSTPQTVRLDAGVCQLMRHSFGGGTQIGGRSYVSARRPGIQAFFERLLKSLGYLTLADGNAFAWAGNGTLDNGSLISAEQFLLDLEVTEALLADWTAPRVPPAGETVARLRDGILRDGGNFLTSEHTLAHYRDELWTAVFLQSPADARTEKQMLDCCHAEYLKKVESYQPASRPKPVLQALERILVHARHDLA